MKAKREMQILTCSSADAVTAAEEDRASSAAEGSAPLVLLINFVKVLSGASDFFSFCFSAPEETDFVELTFAFFGGGAWGKPSSLLRKKPIIIRKQSKF